MLLFFITSLYDKQYLLFLYKSKSKTELAFLISKLNLDLTDSQFFSFIEKSIKVSSNISSKNKPPLNLNPVKAPEGVVETV